MYKKLLNSSLIAFVSVLSVHSQSPKENPGNKGLQYLKDNKDKFDYTSDDCDGSYLSDVTYNKINGAWHIYCQQTLENHKILNAVTSVTIDKQGNIFSVADNWVSHKSEKIVSGSVVSTKEKAMESALTFLNLPNEQIKQPELVTLNTKYKENHTYAELVWVKNNDEKLNLTWRIVINVPSSNDWHNVFVNASTNEVLSSHNWTTSCDFGHAEPTHENPKELNIEQTYKVNAVASYNVFAFPIESPIHGNRSIVNTIDAVASPFGWHDTDGITGPELTITRGNNVYAALDATPDNNPEFSPDGTSNLDFNFSFNSSLDPTVQKSAIITQLFYANNMLHDISYRYGFDEQSGNFQLKNFGKGGEENDEVNADAQDGSGTNNANFASPPDGASGRMQMFLWFSGVTAQPKLMVTKPAPISKTYTFAIANFGPRLSADVVKGDLVLVNDGTSTPQKGCKTIINSAELNGKIALVERGYCTFMNKALMVQNAGAIGMILYDTSTKVPFNMTTDASITTPITITSVMISKNDGATIKNKLADTVEVLIYDSSLVGVKRYDSDLDNGIMAHEYGHGISTRLTCGPSNSDGLKNQEQMGEGWSDFFSLAFTVTAGDISTKPRGIGTFVKGQTTSGAGIRTFRYTTDMTINPHTYNNIKTESVPHGVGSVWCAMLWDLYWAMVDRYGMDNNIASGTGGNNKTLQLVIDGMKLQKCSPGFIDARNAILKADSLNNSGKNADLIWKSFAKRGLGFSASQGLSSSRSDGTQAFDLPGSLSSVEPLNNLNSISIYPNPSTGQFYINSGNLIVNSISLSDVLGREIKGNIVISNQKIDLTNLPDGIYLVKINTPQGSVIKKVNKK